MLSYFIFNDAGDPGIHVQNIVTEMSNSPFCFLIITLLETCFTLVLNGKWNHAMTVYGPVYIKIFSYYFYEANDAYFQT